MNINKKILIVEDDTHINNLLAKLLSEEKYSVVQAFSGTEALLHLKSDSFALILLDLMLPGMNGEELIENIRSQNNVPIIIISAKIDKESKISLLRMGADDYITKPFDMDEVLARVYAQLRRSSTQYSSEESSVLTFKDISLDIESKSLSVNSKPVVLTAIEFKIIQLFLEHPSKVFSKGNLFESVWGDNFLGDDNTVNVHMSNLRSKLNKANPSEDYIETIWGMGYKLAK